jgi:hypothetical protein
LSIQIDKEVSFAHFQLVTPIKEDNYAFYWLMKANDNAWGVAKRLPTSVSISLSHYLIY